ncbi:homeobox protein LUMINIDEPENDENS-like isoform X1 [Cucurbita moschata]|uniref:Homeobox protein LUMINIDEPENDENS-like isoform X1 n=2 Tax=Cucurbita moschata TaxID=3662 RepID=A0A6J1H884_CUCMO|nr:homeobox protein LUMINIDEPENDENS-like isoform X1 [Cucurbita moschata]
MEVVKDDFSNLEIGTSVESFQKFLDSQNDLFRSQVDQLQRVVVTQCKLTGANPLSQEMAAGALSITIGKRPRDLLNPKAVKYMQTVFSIKDALSKKESREISALFGVKVAQVRDFFNSQRSRVRKLVRLSRERSIQSNSCKQLEVGGIATNNDPSMPIDAVPLNSDALVPLNSDAPIPLNSEAPVPLNFATPVPLNTIEPSNVDNGPSCSTQDSKLSDIDGIDKHFVQTIFSMMQKEETFSGQVKLMEWILQIQNSSVLCWFLTKDGAIILATWLSQAAAEEQTSLLHVILEVFCHLPLHKALPMHISAILQSVNNLRFYRTSDISNRARFLISRWSKLLIRSQALKKPNGMKLLTNSQTDMILKQSIGGITSDESWKSNIDIPENFGNPSVNVDNMRKSETHQALKLLPASSDDSNRKNVLGLSSSRFRERRKVQMVEQPEQKVAGRNLQAPRTPASQGRPMSTDDIQKAKMRAQFMQSKYGKTGLSNGRTHTKSENVNKPLHSSASSPASKISLRPKFEDQKKAMVLLPKNSNKVETPLHSKIEVEFKDSLGEKCKRVQIQWRMPPEMKFNDLWRVGGGDNSKEAGFQKNRNSREKETFYKTILEIPPNPKEPWDLEMDYDDSLTPEILTEQLPDNESSEPEIRNCVVDGAVPSEVISSQDLKPNAAADEPDLELLAVLLKNPELVYALTSSQAGNLPAQETVKLLDMIKAGVANGVNGMETTLEKVEVSLPSPTPSSDAGTSGWKPAVFKNPFSQRDSIAESRVALPSPPVDTSSIAVSRVPPVSQQLPASVSQFSLPQTMINRLQHDHVVHSHQHQHQQGVLNPNVRLPNSEVALASRSFPITKLPLVNQSTAAASSVRIDGGNDTKPVSFASSTLERVPISFQSPPSPTPTRMPPIQQQRQQPQLQPYRSEHPHQTRVNISSSSAEKSAPGLGSWRPRLQDIGSHYNSGGKHNNESKYVGGPMAGRGGGPSWGRNEFESWSPENSPVRTQEYSRPARSYGAAEQQRQSSSPYGYGEQNRHGNNSRRWHDRQY